MMRRTVILLPGLLGRDPEDSPLLQSLPTLRALAEMGELKRLAPVPPVEAPEALWLGLSPTQAQMRQGPLTVAALGADPPERSTHFHLSLAGVVDGDVVAPPAAVPNEELQAVLAQAKKLDTRTLTVVPGMGADHGLVWEERGDLHTVPLAEAVGQPVKTVRPEGDGEKELRRFIDDSVNLLSELELNERRLDEGLPPLNLLWPWGHGPRTPVPNLLLQRGERASVISGSMRLAGLSRLAGYRHGDVGSIGRGINTRLEDVAKLLLSEDLAIFACTAPGDLKEEGKLEELHWFTKEMDSRLHAPLFEAAVRNMSRITVLATGPERGLALNFEPLRPQQNSYPFDERSLEERSLDTQDLWTSVATALRPNTQPLRPDPKA